MKESRFSPGVSCSVLSSALLTCFRTKPVLSKQDNPCCCLLKLRTTLLWTNANPVTKGTLHKRMQRVDLVFEMYWCVGTFSKWTSDCMVEVCWCRSCTKEHCHERAFVFQVNLFLFDVDGGIVWLLTLWWLFRTRQDCALAVVYCNKAVSYCGASQLKNSRCA